MKSLRRHVMWKREKLTNPFSLIPAMATAIDSQNVQLLLSAKFFFLFSYPAVMRSETRESSVYDFFFESETSFCFPPSLCRAALSVCCSFHCVLERHDLGSTNICLFRRTHTHTHKPTSQFTREPDDPQRCVCVCLSIIFLRKNSVLLLVGFEIIYISDSFFRLAPRNFQFACCKGFARTDFVTILIIEGLIKSAESFPGIGTS